MRPSRTRTPSERDMGAATPDTTADSNSFYELTRQNHHEEPLQEVEHITDRGWRAWLAVVGGFINYWAGMGMLNSFGTFQAGYLDEAWAKETSLSAITWIGSVQPGLLFFLGGLIGFASDKISAGTLIMVGTLLFLASYLLVAEYGNSFGVVLALQGFMYGFSNTLLYYPVTSIISDWFDRRRGLALGLSAAGSSIGGIFWPIVVDKLHREFGMKRALQGVGLIPLVPLIVSAFLVKERPGRVKITLRDLLWLRNGSEHPDTADGKGGGAGSRGILEGLKTVAQPRFLALSAALFFIFGGFLVPFNYIPLFAEYNGRKSMGNILLAICYSGSAVGRVGTGALADRLGTFNVLCATSFFAAALTLCWVTMRTLPSMITFAVLYGLASGGIMPLGSACIAKITPRSAMDYIGFRIGFMMMICSVSAFGCGPLAGFLLESHQQQQQQQQQQQHTSGGVEDTQG